MIRKIQKNNGIKLLSVFFVCVAIFAFLFHTGVFSNFFTKYSKGFTYKKFHTIFVGQKMQDVHNVLGEPFIDSSEELSCDWYSEPSGFGGRLGITDFTGWISVKVCYDKNNSVRGTAQDTFFN